MRRERRKIKFLGLATDRWVYTNLRLTCKLVYTHIYVLSICEELRILSVNGGFGLLYTFPVAGG